MEKVIRIEDIEFGEIPMGETEPVEDTEWDDYMLDSLEIEDHDEGLMIITDADNNLTLVGRDADDEQETEVKLFYELTTVWPSSLYKKAKHQGLRICLANNPPKIWSDYLFACVGLAVAPFVLALLIALACFKAGGKGGGGNISREDQEDQVRSTWSSCICLAISASFVFCFSVPFIVGLDRLSIETNEGYDDGAFRRSKKVTRATLVTESNKKYTATVDEASHTYALELQDDTAASVSTE